MSKVACVSGWLSAVWFFWGLGCGVSQVQAMSLIDTGSQWNQVTQIQSFGQNGGVDAMGQTFTVSGPETILESFSFWVDTTGYPKA